MKKVIERGTGFLRRSLRSRKPPNGIVPRSDRLRTPALSDKPVGGR